MVNFEDGTLIKGAYVLIDGIEYPVHMPEYSGTTPVSSENLNKMQTDLQKEIEEKTKIKTQIDTIYSNETGSMGTITLNKNISDYEYIEIIFADDWGYESSIKIQVRNSKPAEAWGVLSISRIADNTSIVLSSYIKISGKILTFIEGSCGSHNSWNNTIVEGNKLKIKYVLGYK